ncbi:hypothetical protein Tco_0967885 [Tanacetum coccineum]
MAPHQNEDEAVMLEKSGKKLKGVATVDPTVQSFLDLQKGSKASRLESIRQEMLIDKGEGDDNENDDEDSDMDIDKDDYEEGDDNATGFGVFVHDKTKELPKFTPISPTVTCSSLENYTILLNDLP